MPSGQGCSLVVVQQVLGFHEAAAQPVPVCSGAAAQPVPEFRAEGAQPVPLAEGSPAREHPSQEAP